ncbi:MAG: hypothetical protein ACRD96_23330, partial [Bryobacteraceae bacterium]
MSRSWVLLFAFALDGQVVPGRYLVELDEAPTGSRRTQIRAQQQRARGALALAGADVLDSLEHVANALIVRIDEGDAGSNAARLASIPGVRRVHPVRELHLLLDRALPLHHVPEAWALAGVGRAGAGIKIAIIDTGIDIDHPGMQDTALTPPTGFPKTGADGDEAFTNQKVIVARSYARLLPRQETDLSPRVRVGHG